MKFLQEKDWTLPRLRRLGLWRTCMFKAANACITAGVLLTIELSVDRIRPPKAYLSTVPHFEILTCSSCAGFRGQALLSICNTSCHGSLPFWFHQRVLQKLLSSSLIFSLKTKGFLISFSLLILHSARFEAVLVSLLQSFEPVLPPLSLPSPTI